MADKFINLTDLAAIKTWTEGQYGKKADLTALSERVEEIIAEGGEPNVIEKVKVNGVELTPDANKAVNIEVSGMHMSGTGASFTDTSGNSLIISANNDPQTGDATSVTFAGDGVSFDHELPTRDAMIKYVGENGGKINKIKVNGTEQTITNKEVDLTVPTKLSDLTNDGDGDSPFPTTAEMEAAIESGVGSVVRLKGSVASYADLPAENNKHGDLWDTLDTGKNYVWIVEDGVGRWDEYGGAVDLSAFWTSEAGQTNTLVAATVAEINEILNA